MSVHTSGNQKAYGNTIYVRASSGYSINVSKRLLNKDNDFIDKIVIHEVVHLGHSQHT